MPKTVSLSEARRRLGEIIRQAQTEPVILTRYGQPYVVMLSVQEYERLPQVDVRHIMQAHKPNEDKSE